jgi:8-oxo-dGTP pyrophosphatase MutT (NUDIX family)
MTSDHFYQNIKQRLSKPFTSESRPSVSNKTAAVALILRQTCQKQEILFIERARHPDDPWSGNIGFPGGHCDAADPSPRYTAERETMEEVGIDLSDALYLGRLSDIVGSNLPIRVSCFVYGLNRQVQPVLARNEVNDLFWFGLQQLRQEERHLMAKFQFDDKLVEAPAIDLGLPGKPLLWGITYRLVDQFQELLSCDETGSLPYELPI